MPQSSSRRWGKIICRSGKMPSSRDLVLRLVSFGRLKAEEFTNELLLKEALSKKKPKQKGPEHVPAPIHVEDVQYDDRRQMVRKLWRTAFEKDRRRTVDRTFKGQGLMVKGILSGGKQIILARNLQRWQKRKPLRLVNSLKFENNIWIVLYPTPM